MTTGRKKSTKRKLRVKAKKSPRKAPWGHNDDGKKKKPTRAGKKSSEVKGREVQ